MNPSITEKDWQGENPPYPIYFNPILSTKKNTVFVANHPVDYWNCEFIQLDPRAEQIGIFLIRSASKTIFVAFSGEQRLRKSYRTLINAHPSEKGAVEDIRLFEMACPVCFSQMFNLFNFIDCCLELKRLAETLLQCYDECDETLNIQTGRVEFESVIKKLILQYLSLMVPSENTSHMNSLAISIKDGL